LEPPLTPNRGQDLDPNFDRERAGANLRALRAERDLTQSELAWEAAIAEGALSSYERGLRDVPLRALLRLARTLGVSASEIVPELAEVPEQLEPLSAGIQAINEGDMGALADLLAPDLIRHDLSGAINTLEGPEGLIGYFDAMRRAIPNLRLSLTGSFTAGEFGAAKITYEGRHLRELFGVEPSGAIVRMSGIILFRLEEGRFQEIWQLADLVSPLATAHSIEAVGREASL
jgi:transcriptional regulator with XRE-family HTH domain